MLCSPQRLAAGLLVFAIAATSCTSSDPAALPATTIPATATPVLPTATPVPPTPIPAPATPAPTTPPTAAPLPPAPTVTANDVWFMPILAGVFNYPEIGLDQIENDLEAEALWTAIELNNATAQMGATGSIDDLPIYDALKERGLIDPEYAQSVERGMEGLGGVAVVAAESAFTEVIRTIEDNQLVLTLCAHIIIEIPEDSTATIEPFTVTQTRAYKFAGKASSFTLVGLEQVLIDDGEFVPCEL